MENIIITKPIIPEDVFGIQEVFYKTWFNTYPNKEIGITEEDIEERFKNRLDDENIQKRIDTLSNLPENQLFLVAKLENKVVGLCRVSKNDEHNKLIAIYILPEYQRMKIGGMLWSKAKDFLDKSKDTIVEVVTYNQNAINFYKKIGFIDTGKRFSEEKQRMPISGVLIPEMEMILKTK
ncbi:MAG: GNAT family N-acetyltransferase [Candidatus Nomurabacteria bacterium]